MLSQTQVGTGTSTSGAVTVRADLMARLGVAARVARGPELLPEGAILAAARVLRTRRLTMRPLVEQDRAEFLRVLVVSKGHLRDFCPLGTDEARTDEEIFARQLALSEGAARTGRACRLAAFDRDGRLVGGFNINDITRGLENSGELVFWVSADAVLSGYAEEGTRALMAHGFADLPTGLGLHRLVALVAPANDGCRKVARKVGLALSPSSARVELSINGRLVGHDVYEAFASLEQVPPGKGAMARVVEGKPSIAEELFGRGLLTILKTEAAESPGHSGGGGG